MRKVIRVLLWLVGALAAVVSAVLGYATWEWDRTVEAPYPPITADRSPAGVARGAAIFHSTCEACHRGAGSERATGAHMTDAPEFLGSFHAANITSHSVAGVGALEDKEIARVIRFSVNRHSKHMLMPKYTMGDADIAAVIGFMRSTDPLFAADATVAPASKLSPLGKTLLLVTGEMRIPSTPAQGVPVPEKAATVAYGRYLAHSVYDCAGCHTAGWGADKTEGPELFAGGFEFRDPQGNTVQSRNLTPDVSGIAHYGSKDLARALHQGVRPDGTVLSSPMPLFRGLEDVEIEALYAYLRSVPARHAEGPARTPAPAASAPLAASDPAARFRALGCVSCHGPGAAHADALVRAAGKPAPELAGWIRNPERTIPGTPMPTYAELIDEPGALELATWIKSGGAQRMAQR